MPTPKQGIRSVGALSIPAEETILLPLWAMRALRHGDHEPANYFFAERGSQEQRLIQIVGLCVTALDQPILQYFCSGEPGAPRTPLATAAIPWRTKLYRSLRVKMFAAALGRFAR